MKVKVGISARHVHLSKEDFNILFSNYEFYSIRDLSQIGEFSSNLTVSIKTNTGVLENVRVVGPLRDKTQVEISRSDAYILGINPPVKMSGDLEDAINVSIVSNKFTIDRKCCILACRHIHINKKDENKYNLKDGDIVKAVISGDRGGVLDNVKIKSKDTFVFELHLDIDEANAFNLNNGDLVEIIKEENKL